MSLFDTCRIQVKVNNGATAKLILIDGCNFSAERGITVAPGSALEIYAGGTSDATSIEGTGKLTAQGGGNYAGIGGKNDQAGGMVIIHGGTVEATGGSRGAGIGGGLNGAGGTVTIYGGTVEATGGLGAHGIGKGENGSSEGSLTVGEGLTVYGGASPEPTTVIALSDGDYARPQYMQVTAAGSTSTNTVITYADQTYSNGVVTSTPQTTSEYTVLTSGTTTWNGGVYVLNSDVEIGNRITVNGTSANPTKLILIDGKTLNASKGIAVAYGNTLEIYAGNTNEAIEGTGTLVATGNSDAAGIGGGYYGSGGTINIYGGTVTAQGGNYAAGIGGGYNGSGRTVNIYGGTVTAQGGDDAAGIGGGMHSNGGQVTINDGTISATGGNRAAGIGGGSSGNGGTVTINGGTVTANGGGATGETGMGIGKGYTGSNDGTLILGEGVSMLVSTDNSTWTAYDTTSNRAKYMKTGTLEPQTPVSYVYYTVSGTTATKHTDGSYTEYTAVTSNTTAFADGKWYVVSDDVTVADRITVTGTANLILCDGKTLTTSKGITVNEGNTLNIYAQEDGTGTLIATGSTQAAGIGGDAGSTGGTLNVHGGNLTATGGSGEHYCDCGAGIGGGTDGDGGMVTIFDGTVTANAANLGAAGIGGGGFDMRNNNTKGGNGGSFTIYGGTVNATGASENVYGAGIGGGASANGGEVIINGGTVTATGGWSAAGIGGGKGGNGGNVTINGGSVIASSPSNDEEYGMGIGTGYNGSNDGTLILGEGVSMLVSTDNSTWTAYDPTSNNRAKYMKTGIEPQTPVSYVYYTASGTTATKHTDGSCTEYTAVTSSTTAFADDKWYVVSDDVTVADRITVSGTANLILCDGKTLTASKGITVTGENTLNIYAQSEGDTAGTLVATGSYDAAGIGGGYCGSGGTVNIYGGTVTAQGGDDAAGIGGGYNGSGGTVNIYGGIVTAQGGDDAAGIGGGMHGNGGQVTINDGTINATGGNKAAGIGGGSSGNGGTITINGGTVTANGGGDTGEIGMGIGKGYTGSNDGTLRLGDGVGMLVSTDNSTWTAYDPTSNNRAKYMKTGTITPETVATPASTVTAPTAKTLTYNGKAQELVSAGTAEGGEMQYALGTDATTAPTTGYTSAIPTGTNADTYYVWYKAAGDADHSDSVPACITVTVAKKAVTVKASDQTVVINGEIITDTYKAVLTGAGEGHTLASVSLTTGSTAELTESGVITPGEAVIKYGETDVTGNYEITYENGVLTVANKATAVILDIKDNEGNEVETAVTNVECENLSNFTEEQTEATVEVELTVKPVSADIVEETVTAEIANVISTAFADVNSAEVTTEYLELEVTKKVTTEGTTATTEIHDVERVLEIVLSYNLTGKYNPVIIREHEGTTTAFERLAAKPAAEPYTDGTFYVDKENNKIYIYSRYFSTYSIAYSTVASWQVTFDDQNGNVTQNIVSDGAKVANRPVDPSRSGYTFAGWYKEAACTNAWNFEADTVTADTTVYAKWNEISSTPYAQWTAEQASSETTPDPVPTVPTVTPKQPDQVPAADTVTKEEKVKGKVDINSAFKVYQSGKKVVVEWGEVEDADMYAVYAAYCGGTYSLIKTITDGSLTFSFKKLDGAQIDFTKNFKVYVAAYRSVDGEEQAIAKTIKAHVVGSENKKRTNAASISTEKSKYSVKAGDTFTIKATTVLADPRKKQLSNHHAAEFRYLSTDKSIATVSKDGTVTGVSKGTCYIWVYSRNGLGVKVKVTVK